MSTKGRASYEIPIESRLYPKELRTDLRTAPPRLYVIGNPLALTGGVCLEGRADARLGRDAGAAIARAGRTLVVARGRDWRLDAIEGALSMGGRVVVWSPLAPDVTTSRLRRLERALSSVTSRGGAIVSSHIWGRRDSRAVDSTRAASYARACARVTMTPADAAHGVALEHKASKRRQAVVDCQRLARTVELAYLRHDVEGDPILPLAETLLAGGLCYQPGKGMCLFLSDEWAPYGMTTLVCRDKVGVPGLALCESPMDVVELGLEVGTVDLLLDASQPFDLAEAISCLPRRVLCGAISSILNSPFAWLSGRDPSEIALALGYEAPQRKNDELGINPPLSEQARDVPREMLVGLPHTPVLTR